jgi:biopolymer transport protein ExbB
MQDERWRFAAQGFGLAHWWRIGMMICALLAFGHVWSGSLATSPVIAQDDALEDPLGADDAASATPQPAENTASSSSGGGGRSMFQVIMAAGWYWVLLFLLVSLAMVFFIIEHSITIRKSTLLPEPVLLELEEMIAQGQIPQAIEYCHLPENESLASEVVLAGLERYRGSDFGFAEYKTAVEEAGEDYLGRLYRKTEVLGVIGAVAPMLGLMGTVMGMISAFNTMAMSDAAPKPSELAGGIGQALLTTLFGLSIAIPSMISFSFFRNKIDSIVSEAGKRIERIMMPLGRKR